MENIDLTKRIEKRYSYVEERNKNNSHEFFFKNKKGYLLGYIRINYIELGNQKMIYINETTSSYRFEYHPDFFKRLYLENGYNSSAKLKDFGKDMYLYVFNFVLKKYPDVKIIHSVAEEKIENIKSICRIIKKVSKICGDIIEQVDPSGRTVLLK